VHTFKANRAIVANPQQSLLVTQNVSTKEYTALFINKKFIEQIAYDICGRSEVQFINDNYIISKQLIQLFENFIYEYTNIHPTCPLMLDSISTQIAIQILRRFSMDNKIIFFEGQPGSGKSTLSQYICQQIQLNGESVYWLDEYEHDGMQFSEFWKKYDNVDEDIINILLNCWKGLIDKIEKTGNTIIMDSAFFSYTITS